MYSGDETAVALKEKIPVHIVYFTAWPRPGGRFETWPDDVNDDIAPARSQLGMSRVARRGGTSHH